MKLSFFIVAVVLINACQSPQGKEPASPPPSRLANVFQPLDGKWRGKFYVYTNPEGQSNSGSQPKELSKEFLKSLPLVIKDSVEVEQHYYSNSPFLQQVKIMDTYFQDDGTLRTVLSEGYNQVKDGRLICLINKPEEKVMHSGSWDGDNTIKWERNKEDPLVIEFFLETVEDSVYTILGWGYYGEDDPELNPKTWFFAEYYRIE